MHIVRGGPADFCLWPPVTMAVRSKDFFLIHVSHLCSHFSMVMLHLKIVLQLTGCWESSMRWNWLEMKAEHFSSRLGLFSCMFLRSWPAPLMTDCRTPLAPDKVRQLCFVTFRVRVSGVIMAFLNKHSQEKNFSFFQIPPLKPSCAVWVGSKNQAIVWVSAPEVIIINSELLLLE